MEQYNDLNHSGVMGMKWGHRQAQPTSDSLSKSQQNKVSKQYKKLAIAGNKELTKNHTGIYVNAYNKAADKMNNGGIDKFNANQEKKYGKNFAKRKGYDEDYMKMFDKEMSKNYNQLVLEFRQSNTKYKKADELVKKYGMTKWDDLAKNNQETIDTLKKSLNTA